MITVELVNVAEVPEYRPSWLPRDVTDYSHITRGLLELGYCMENNPAPFSFAEIKQAVVTSVTCDADSLDSYGDGDWDWDVELIDGRRFHVHGEHDYTGWDCQSSAEYTEASPLVAQQRA